MSKAAVSIACGSGFWGDTPLAITQLLEEKSIDYIAFDYLSEVTMTILAKQKKRDPESGYTPDFFSDVIEPHLETILARKIKLITNAGGMNPLALKKKIDDIAKVRSLKLRVNAILGDDLLANKSLPETIQDFSGISHDTKKFVSANAYLGAKPIAEALAMSADIVITGRCVDAALFVGPIVHELKIAWDDYDALAQASLAGHILECGTQCTGGNFTDWKTVPQRENMGFPIVQFFPNKRFIVTKGKNTGGLVSVASVSEQIVYEIGDPKNYLLPDVNCDFTEVHLEQKSENEVVVSGAKGSSPPNSYKVSATSMNGVKISATAFYLGADSQEKARSAGEAILNRCHLALQTLNNTPYSETRLEVFGSDQYALLRLSAAHTKPEALEILAKEIAPAATSLAPGLTNLLSAGRAQATPRIALTSFPLEKQFVPVHLDNGQEVSAFQAKQKSFQLNPHAPAPGKSPNGNRRVRLRDIAWARSGDKGNDVNIGVIARSPKQFKQLQTALTEKEIVDFFLDDFDDPKQKIVNRWSLPGIYALNFLIKNCLGGGGAYSLRIDPQGKAFAQRLLELSILIEDESL